MDTTIKFTLSVTDGTGTVDDTVLVTVTDDGRNLDDDFVTVWETKTDNNAIMIPVGDSASTYAVDWGDGTMNRGVTGNAMHVYGDAGSHTVRIFGGFERIYLGGNGTNAAKLQSIGQWGNASWASMSGAFEGAENMVYRATDVPDLSGVTNMSGMFHNATSFNGDISAWDVSQATDMSGMFTGATAFEQNLGDWLITLDSTSIDDAPGIVANITAQNQFLTDMISGYGIGTSDDQASFDIVDKALNMTAISPDKTSYVVNITSPGPDNFGANNHRVYTIMAVDANDPPDANAGENQTVTEGDTVTLDGSGSSDPDAGDSLTYLWRANRRAYGHAGRL